MLFKIFILNLVPLVVLRSIEDDNYNTTESYDTVFPSNYKNEKLPPTQRGTPIVIYFGMTVIDINSINVEDMDFRMDMFLTQEWTDHRITVPEEMYDRNVDYINLPVQYFNDLWQPDLYFLNSKIVEIATLTHTFSSIVLFKNKTVRYTARMYAIVACQMEFQYYPMDTQVCPVNIESFTYDANKLELQWANGGVTVSPELKLLQYNMKNLELGKKTVLASNKIGNFSRLIVFFRFERLIGHQLIHTFAPSTLIVVISWFGFWMGLDAIPGRVALLVTCLLTLVTMFTGLRSDIPAVAYIKALDIWMAGCMFFVFAALGEFVIVKVSSSKYDKRKKLAHKRDYAVGNMWSTRNLRNEQLLTMSERRGIFRHSWQTRNGKEKILWVEIDGASTIIFPICFVIFVVMYWTTLIILKGKCESHCSN